eukprot:4058252-Prymnesium_polylepis.2
MEISHVGSMGTPRAWKYELNPRLHCDIVEMQVPSGRQKLPGVVGGRGKGSQRTGSFKEIQRSSNSPRPQEKCGAGYSTNTRAERSCILRASSDTGDCTHVPTQGNGHALSTAQPQRPTKGVQWAPNERTRASLPFRRFRTHVSSLWLHQISWNMFERAASRFCDPGERKSACAYEWPPSSVPKWVLSNP